MCVCVCEQITCTFRSREHGGGDGAGQAGQMTNGTRARTCTYAQGQVVENHIIVLGFANPSWSPAGQRRGSNNCPFLLVVHSWSVPAQVSAAPVELSGESIHGCPI